MHNPSRRKCRISGRQPFRLIVYPDDAAALEDHIQLVLPFMSVRGMLLSRFERV